MKKRLDGITSRIGVGDKLDAGKKPDARKDDRTGGSPMRLGGGGEPKPAQPKQKRGVSLLKKLPGLPSLGSGKKQEAPKPNAPAGAGGSAARSPVSGGGASAGSTGRAAAPKAGRAKGLALGELLAKLNPLKPRQESRAAKAARAGKPVEVRTLSLSLDKKLEILGLVMVIGGIVLLLSSLSPAQGALPNQINDFLSELFGWGAIAVPIAMIPVGLWLIMLRAGQETPVVDVGRVIGLIALYIAVLVLFQFIDALSYPQGANQSYEEYLRALDNVLLPLSAAFGRGGGIVGGRIYFFLISNFGEIAGFVLLIGALLIAAMFALSLSMQEIVAIFISNYRNLRDAQRRRALRRAAERAEREAAAQAQAALAASSISVVRPESEQLAAGTAPALPAAAAVLASDDGEGHAEGRSIPITMGGRTITAPFRASESVLVEAGSAPAMPELASPQTASAPPAPHPTEEEKPSRTGLLGGIGGRLRGAPKPAPASAAAAEAKPAQAAEAARGGLLGGRLFARGISKPASTEAQVAAAADEPPVAISESKSETIAPAAEKLPLAPEPQTPTSAAAAQPRPSSSAKDGESSTKAAEAEDAQPVRLGDPLRPPVPSKPAIDANEGGEGTSRTAESPVGRAPFTLRPSPFARPESPAAAAKPDGAALKEGRPADETKETSQQAAPALGLTADRPAIPRPGAPAASGAPSGAVSRPPFVRPFERPLADRLASKPAPLDVKKDEDDEDDWSKLPPARPKGIETSPAQAGGGGKGEAKSAMAIPDLQTRLNALRAAQPAADTEAGRDKPNPTSQPFSPAGSAVERRAPRIVPFDEDDEAVDEPFKAELADDADSEAKRPVELAPAAATESPKPAETPSVQPTAASPLGRPETPPVPSASRPESAPAASHADVPAAASGLRPFSRSTTTAGGASTTPHGSAPASPPPAARAAAPLVGAAGLAAAGLAAAGAAANRDRETTAPARDPAPPPQPQGRGRKAWRLPDLGALLSTGQDQELNHALLLERARVIEDTLSSFGAPGRVVEVRTGPVITQFGVEPDYIAGRGGKKNRVKVSAIAALDKDLQLALGAKSIRIEAPVPGKGYVGIEVPNDQASIVSLRDVMESQEFRRIKSPLAIALGQGVDGTPVAADLTAMPHLLIAGTTGSGKSVCVNTIIASLLLRNTPEQLKFIMVDPKRVELTGYNGIPHLVAPVVVELERIVSVLKWVTREMDERYRRFSNAGARNIEDFNKHLPASEQPMPYIVVIIDELADLMMLAPDETERVITRIAALARATGIHLVIATQRPSVDVVTGLIKANFPARIAFAVAGSVDSRVILDQPGAERLLGRGDMLYMSGDSPAPVRLQGVYVSDNEISAITRFWRDQLTDEDLANASRPILSAFALDEASRERETASGSTARSWAPGGASRAVQQAFWDRADDSGGSDGDDDGEDVMYGEAVELVRRLNKASVSLLQRRLRIGYTRAARLIDMMEERGVVGPPVEGSKPREVLPPKG
ncbi:MAG: DNA translocase FtsK [Aggregatilineales bacterium]